jgi:hypothetical protein
MGLEQHCHKLIPSTVLVQPEGLACLATRVEQRRFDGIHRHGILLKSDQLMPFDVPECRYFMRQTQ